MKRLALLLFVLALPVFGQTHKFGALNTNNVWTAQDQFQVGVQLGPVTFSQLPSLNNGTIIYCTDCQQTNPCVGSGSGAFAIAIGGVWTCQIAAPPLSGITGATANGGLVQTSTTLGLLLTCSNNQVLQWNTTAWVCATIAGGGTITGSGTSGNLAEFTASSAIGNAPITDNTTNTLTLGSAYKLLTNYQPTTCAGSCTALRGENTFIASGNWTGPLTGTSVIAHVSSSNSSGTQTGSELDGMTVVASNSGNSSGGTSLVTLLNGINVQVQAAGEGAGATTTNQNGVYVLSTVNSSGLTITNNKGVDVVTGAAGSVGSITNDFGIYVEPLVSGTGMTNHSGIYVADQGAQNEANATWYGIFIASQSVGPGFTKPTYPIWVNGGPVHFAGNIELTNLWTSSTAPTISSGFGSGASIPHNNGTAVFTINVGTSSASTGVIGLPTAVNGWDCKATDITTNSTSVFVTKQTASSQTSCTIGNFSDVAAGGAWANNDILSVTASAY